MKLHYYDVGPKREAVLRQDDLHSIYNSIVAVVEVIHGPVTESPKQTVTRHHLQADTGKLSQSTTK
jgi:hypothetical protein